MRSAQNLEHKGEDVTRVRRYFANAFAEGATPVAAEDVEFLRSLPIYPMVGPSTQQLQVRGTDAL